MPKTYSYKKLLQNTDTTTPSPERKMKAVKGHRGLYISDDGVYKIRIAIPEKVQKFYNMKKEINQSLRTKDFSKAKDEYHRLIAQIERKFDLKNKKQCHDDRPLFPEDVFEEELLKNIYYYFTEYSGLVQDKLLEQLLNPFPEPWEINENMKNIKNKDLKWIQAFNFEIRSKKHSATTLNMLKRLMNSQYRLSPEQEEKASQAFAQTVIEAAIFHIKTAIDCSHTPENYPFQYEIVKKAYNLYAKNNTLYKSATTNTQNTKSATHQPQNIIETIKNRKNKPTKIQELLILWQNDQGDKIKEKVPHITTFIKFFPEKEILNNICTEDILTWVELLKITPANISKIKEFKNLQLEDILNANTKLKYPCLTPKTINTYINSFSCFHKWAKTKRYINSSNPTTDTLFSKKDIKAPPPETYSHAEIRQIIDYISKQKLDNLDLYWAIMIAIYSGMRSGEVCQLRPEDIRERDGVLCFSVNDEKNKTVKNQHSIRMIPIHNKLIELNIQEFIAERKKQNNDSLFPSFKIYKRGNRYTFHKCFSQPFSQILEKLNLKKENRLVHSLRHTFIDALRISGLSDNEIQYLVGHEKQIMTNQYGRLADQTPIRTFQEWINKVDYDA